MNPDEETPGSDGRVLAPEELDLANKEGVEEIEEGRYVVSPDGTRPNLPEYVTEGREAARSESASGASGTQHDDPPSDAEREEGIAANRPSEQERRTELPATDRASAREWYESQLEDSPCRYGYYVSLKADRGIDHHTLHTDDVAMAFNNLLLWYARNVDDELPPGAVLGVLLSEASIPLRYPVKSFEEFLMKHGLSTDDTIADLLDVLREEGEVVFPPR